MKRKANMKKSKLKSPKKKVLSHCYRNKSNTSLSDLLRIASYKKRIKDLDYNNRRLAQELAKARRDIAALTKTIDDCQKLKHQIMFAVVKFNEVTHGISKVVNDFDEGMEHLNFDWMNSQVKLSGNGVSCSKKRAPTIETIEEVSGLSSEHSDGENTPPPPVITPQAVPRPSVSKERRGSLRSSQSTVRPQNLPRPSTPRQKRRSHTPSPPIISPPTVPGPSTSRAKKRSVSSQPISISPDALRPSTSREMRKNLCEIESCSAESDLENIDVPMSVDEISPILFAGESKDFEGNKEKKSSKEKSSERQKCDNRSLTPELDIDFSCFRLKRSSGRRQTKFKISSSGKSKKVSSESVVSPFAESGEECLIETAKEQQIEIFSECFQDSGKDSSTNKSNNLQCHLENLPISNDSEIPKVAHCMPSNVASNLIAPDLTLLLNEDMELTENISAPIFVGKNFALVTNSDCISEITPVPSETEEKCIAEEESSKLPQHFESSDVLLPVSEDKNKQSPLVKESENIPSLEVASFKSFSDSFKIVTPKLARRRHVVKYSAYFSDTSEDENTPKRSKGGKKNSSVDGKRATVIFKPKDTPQAPHVPEDCLSLSKASAETDKAPLETAVFDFNSSQSGKDISTKKSKLSRNKNSAKKKVAPTKPLLNSCNVTKLKGFQYKFSKNDSTSTSNKFGSIGKQLKNSESSSSTNVCISSPGSSVNNEHTSQHGVNYLEQEVSTSLEEKIRKDTVQNLYRSVLKDPGISSPVPHTPKKIDVSLENSTSEVKRVSFAPTDMVCKFRKMSLSKAIASNKKLRKASKSAFEFEDTSRSGTDWDDKVKGLPGLDVSLDEIDDEVDCLFNFSGDTELYTLTLPPSLACPAANEPPLLSPQITISTVTVKKDHEKKSSVNLPKIKVDVTDPNKKKSKKISLKASSCHKKSLQRKSPMKSLFPPTSILSPSKKARKSQIKLYSESKENQTQNTPGTIKIDEVMKQQTSKSVAPLEDDTYGQTIAIDDILRFKPQSKAKAEKRKTIKKKCPASVESSPVLKDRMNLENICPLTHKISATEKISQGNDDIVEIPKRRSKTVCYKEPSSRKKLRR